MSFQWTHRQRYSAPAPDSFFRSYTGLTNAAGRDAVAYREMRTFGATNAAWQQSWLSDILFWDYSWETNSHRSTTALFNQSYEAFWSRAEGGIDYLQPPFANSDNGLRVKVEPLGSLGRPVVATPVTNADGFYWGGGQTNGLRVVYPDGGVDVYGVTFFLSNLSPTNDPAHKSTARALLTQRIDPQGRITRIGYENVIIGSLNVYRPRYVVDPDGRINTIRYVPNEFWKVSEIEDPYGRKARAEYGSGYGPARLIDAQNLTNSFAYNTSSGWLNSYTTPYGTTSFEYYDRFEPGYTEYYQARAARVTEADGSKQFFVYNHNTVTVTPASVTNLPVVDGWAFDDGATGGNDVELYHRNSFHWGTRQYAALSALVNTSGSIASLLNTISNNTGAYRLAPLQHWLLGADTITATDYLSSEREASPDVAGTVEGAWTFYAYGNGINPELEPNDPFVTARARVLPDGRTWFQSIDLAHLTSGQPVRQRESYTLADGSVGFRTNWFTYATGGIDLLVKSNSVGQVQKFGYNTNHQVTVVTNAYNQIEQFAYVTGTPQLQTVTNLGGQIVTFTYYASNAASMNGGFLKTVQSNPGPTWSFGYDKGLVKYATNDLGLRLVLAWDNLLRLTNTTYPDDSYTSQSYDKLDLVASRDRLGNWTYAGYDALQHLTALTNANNAVTLLDWCGCGALNSVTNALTNTTLFYYNNQGALTNRVTLDASLNPQSSIFYFYDSVNRVTNVLDGLNRSLKIDYNNQGQLTTMDNAFGRLQRTLYDALDRPLEFTDGRGVTFTNQYDLLNRVTNCVWMDGIGEQYGWRTNGLSAYTNRNGQVTRYLRDAAGQLLAVTNANLEVTRFQLNSRGQVTNLWDGLNQQTQFGYDEYGLRRTRTDALTRTTYWNYNANGWLTNRSTPQFGNTFYTYDPVGNLANVTYPSSSIAYTFDALNRLTNMLDGIGTTKFTWTPAGQLASEDGPWINDLVTNTYVAGLRTAMSLNSSNFTYGYDLAWRLTNVTSSAGVFNYGFVGASTLVQKLVLGGAGTITNSFGSLAQLTGTYLKDNAGLSLNLHQYVYDLANLRTQQVFTAGNYLNYAYDSIGQLKTASGKESGGLNRSFEQLGYTYDSAGSLNFRTNNAFLQTFNNNSLNELTTLTRSGTLTVAGNTTTVATNVTVNGATADRYTDLTYARTNFPLVNAFTNFTAVAQSSLGLSSTNRAPVDLRATTTFAYDLNGNLTNDGTRTFIYDSENQLVTNFVTKTWKTEHTYDGFGRKRITRDYGWDTSISNWAKTNEVLYVYDGSLAIQERNASSTPLVTYTRGLDLSGSLQGAGGIGGLLARTDHAATTPQLATSYYHSDGSGNVTALISTNGVVVARYAYDPFGGLTAMSGPLAAANRYRFSSKELQLNSGLYYYGFRFYEPNLQRWLNQDPIGGMGGLNLYGFVGNNPVNLIDPLGLAHGNPVMALSLEWPSTAAPSLSWPWDQQLQLSFPEGGFPSASPKMPPGWPPPYLDNDSIGSMDVEAFELWSLLNPLTRLGRLPCVTRAGTLTAANATPRVVNAQTIQAALEGSTMRTAQAEVSIPAVERYVRMLESGSTAPAIKVADGVIIDGNHRFIAGRVFGTEPPITPGILSPSQAGQVRPIQQLNLNPADFGNH